MIQTPTHAQHACNNPLPLLARVTTGCIMVLEKLLLAGWDVDHRALPGAQGRLAAAGGQTGPAGFPSTSSAAQAVPPKALPPLLLANSLQRAAGWWAPDVDVLDLGGGTTALLVAAAGCEQHGACVSWLLASGARRDATDGRGATPLSVAAAAGNWDAFGLLLPVDKEGRMDGSHSDLAIADSQGRSLLHAAAFGGSHRIVQLLLDAGLDPTATAPGEYGRTCLHHAAAGSGDRQVCELLIRAGCKPHAADAAGSLPWHLAAQKVGDRSDLDALTRACVH